MPDKHERHAHTRDEILAALGHWTRAEQKEMREGVLCLPAVKADVSLFTLNKTDSISRRRLCTKTTPSICSTGSRRAPLPPRSVKANDAG